MSELETNIFPITNLHELESRFRLYHVRGLSIDRRNMTRIYKHSSGNLVTPCEVL